MNSIVIKEFLSRRLACEASGHDVFHAERVCANAFALAREEARPFDADVLEAAALLHDVLDHKLVDAGERDALTDETRACLLSAGLSSAQCEHIFAIWQAMGFQGKDAVPSMPSFEGELVLDADRLDALGAIGIARCFAYGGKKQRLLYNPHETARDFSDAESYRAHAGSSLNHFFEKLFHLRKQMLTPSARRAAELRHRFMEEYVTRFLNEWEGKDL